MIVQKKHFFISNKKAFTLIEVLISVSILVMVFIFIYSQFNLAQLSTKKTTSIEKSTTKRAKIIELLYSDFLTSKNIKATSGRNYDKFIESFNSDYSLYGIDKPYIKYAVITTQEGNNLVRLEGTTSDIDLQNANSEFYIDIIVEDIKFFKILDNTEHIEFFIQADKMKDIYFKFQRFYK